jgi:hypothetical protein
MKKTGGKGEFAALREFVRGYLNQDFEDEYGSAAGAARAYCADANDAESARVAKEWKAFVDGTAGDGVAAVNEKLAELGAEWNVVAVKDLDAVSAVFAEYSTK